MSGVQVRIDDSEVQRLAGVILDRMINQRRALTAVGDFARESIRTNFDVGGRPKAWAGLKVRAGQPLRDTGRLMNSMGRHVSSDKVQVGTNVVYAAIHNFGGQAGRGRKVTIPARPFMLLQDEDIFEVKDILSKWILEGK